VSSQSSEAGTGGIAEAKAQVAKFAASPALVISPLPSRPKTSTYAIQLNCTIPACAPHAIKPAMAALGWKFEELTYDISKGPVAVQGAFTQAIAKKPNVILVGLNFPEATLAAQSAAAIAQGIKLIGIGGNELPKGYSACIQCTPASEAVGALAADVALADAGGKTEIAVANDKTIGSITSEADGVKKEVAKNGEGTPEPKLIDQSISATPANNSARVVSFLQRNPNVKYIVLTSPQFDPSAALKSAGLSSRVKVVGIFPFGEPEVAAVKNGSVFSYVGAEPHALYWRAADAAARAAMNVPVDPTSPLASMRVLTKSNADVALLDPPNFESVYKSAWQVQ
jgi:hypothetical protein